VLGWQAHTALDEGLRRTLAWYRAFFAEATGSQALAAVETSGL
jgi:dTDP-D-glucose 4,6-dehydratase